MPGVCALATTCKLAGVTAVGPAPVDGMPELTRVTVEVAPGIWALAANMAWSPDDITVRDCVADWPAAPFRESTDGVTTREAAGGPSTVSVTGTCVVTPPETSEMLPSYFPGARPVKLARTRRQKAQPSMEALSQLPPDRV